MEHSQKHFLSIIFASANAADFPQKTIRLIVPFPAGGTSDIVARIVAERAGKSLGQQIIIDNRAGSNIGMQAAAKAAPDGYTLGYCSIGTCAINVGVYREKLPYHPERDFTPVMLIGMISNILLANNKLPAKILPKYWPLPNPNPARSPSVRPAMVPRRIFVPNCSSISPASISPTCPTKARRPPSPT